MEDSQLISDVQQLTDGLGRLPEPVVKPAFVAVSGLPGTGKSYFCSKLAVYQRMKPSVQRINRNHYAVDTSRDITPVLDKIVREVRR